MRSACSMERRLRSAMILVHLGTKCAQSGGAVAFSEHGVEPGRVRAEAFPFQQLIQGLRAARQVSQCLLLFRSEPIDSFRLSCGQRLALCFEQVVEAAQRRELFFQRLPELRCDVS